MKRLKLQRYFWGSLGMQPSSIGKWIDGDEAEKQVEKIIEAGQNFCKSYAELADIKVNELEAKLKNLNDAAKSMALVIRIMNQKIRDGLSDSEKRVFLNAFMEFEKYIKPENLSK